MPSDDIKKLEKLAKDNQHLNQEILDHLKVIRRRLFVTQLIAWIKLSVIAVPIILLLIWLPPKLKTVWEDYQGMRGEIGTLLQAPSNPMMLLQQFLTEQ